MANAYFPAQVSVLPSIHVAVSLIVAFSTCLRPCCPEVWLAVVRALNCSFPCTLRTTTLGTCRRNQKEQLSAKRQAVHDSHALNARPTGAPRPSQARDRTTYHTAPNTRTKPQDSSFSCKNGWCLYLWWQRQCHVGACYGDPPVHERGPRRRSISTAVCYGEERARACTIPRQVAHARAPYACRRSVPRPQGSLLHDASQN